MKKNAQGLYRVTGNTVLCNDVLFATYSTNERTIVAALRFKNAWLWLLMMKQKHLPESISALLRLCQIWV